MQLNMAKKSYAMKTGTEKPKKCTSQIFHFKNFVTEIFWNILRDFQNCEIMRIDYFLGQFTTRSCQIRPEIHMPWQLHRKTQICKFKIIHFLIFITQIFSKQIERFSEKNVTLWKHINNQGGILFQWGATVKVLFALTN